MKGKRIVILLLTLCLLLSNFTIVYATETTEETTEQSSGDRTQESKDMQSKMSISDTSYDTFSAIWAAYSVSGLSDEAISAIFGNLYCESGLKGSTVETGNTAQGIGIAQWSTTSNQKGLEEWSKNCGHDTVSVTCANGTFTICTDEACQGAYLLSTLEKDWGNNSSKYNSYAETYKDNTIDGTTWVSNCGKPAIYDDKFQKLPQGVTTYESYSDYKTGTDMSGLAISFFDNHERGAGINILLGGEASDYNVAFFMREHCSRPDKAEACYVIWKGCKAPTSGEGKEAAETIATQLVLNGYWAEEQLSSYCKLTEININDLYLNDALRQNLNGGELSAVTNWKNNVDAIKEETAVQKIFRVGTQLVGILFSVWMLLLYLGFWFDRLNNFFEFSVVEILSFGRLRVSDTEEECTFKATELSKTDVRTVNHRAILTICLIGLAFGVLIITGILYSIISKIVVTATNFFK